MPETEAPVSFRSAVTRAVVDADKENLQIYGVWGGFDGKYNLFDGEPVQTDGSYNGVRYWVNGKVHNFYALHPHPHPHPDNGGLPAAGVTCVRMAMAPLPSLPLTLPGTEERMPLTL